jgi:surface protein
MKVFQLLKLLFVGAATMVASTTAAPHQGSAWREVGVHSGGFLTAPASVQAHRMMRHLSDFAWGIQPEDDYPIIAFNDATENSEAVFKYNHTGTLTADKNITVSLYEYDCVTVADAVALSQISDYSIANEISLDVDIDQETISGSNLYNSLNITTAEILFCVRLDYEFEGESLNFHETQVTISVDLSAGFNLTEILVVRTGADEAAATLDCGVEIYYCYPNHTEVSPAPSYAQGQALEVCVIVKPEDTHCCIVDINNMDIDQDQDNDGEWDAHTDPITDTFTDGLSTKNCTESDGGVCYVKTQLPSKFFSVPNPADLTLTGAAILKICDGAATPARPATPEPAFSEDELTLIVQDWLYDDDFMQMMMPDAYENVTIALNQDLRDAVQGYYFDESNGFPNRSAIVEQYGEIEEWDVSAITNFAFAFSPQAYTGAVSTYLRDTFNANLSNWSTAEATTMRSMFDGASAFVGNDLSGWDVASVTDMFQMFKDAALFNGDVSSWDVSQVLTMQSMFTGASAFIGNDLSGWDVASVTTMDSMFYNAALFNGDVSSWDVSQVLTMRYMFNGALAFLGNGLSDWDVASVTTMEGMFFNAPLFNGNVSSWDVSQVLNMQSMFSSSPLFNGDVSSWDVSQVLTMEGMFAYNSLFNSDLSSWNVSQVQNIQSMFWDAVLFNGDVSSWDVSQVLDMGYVFKGATSFDQNLCAWGSILPGAVTTTNAFQTTGCITQSNPSMAATPPGPFCVPC